MNEKKKQELIAKAVEMKEKAYCPYSKYAVGAAVLCDDESIYTGCNVENASYPAGICAERTAAVKAVSDGKQRFIAVAIAVNGERYAYPCGICRQFLCEFSDKDLIFLLINKNGQVIECTMEDIFPNSFSRKDMNL